MIKNSWLYDRLKFLAQIVLPALGTLYFALAGIWGLPHADEVVGTIVAIDTFLGVVLGISSAGYSSKQVGEIVLSETATKEKYTLALDGDPDEIGEHDEVRFRVKGNKKKPLKTGRHRTGGTSSWVSQSRPT